MTSTLFRRLQTATLPTPPAPVGYCCWNSRFHCLFLIRDRNRHTSDFPRRTKPAYRRPPFSLSPDVFVHPVRPDSNSRRAVADISLEKTMLSVTGKCGPPNAIAPPERQETPRAGARRARLSDLKEEYDEL